MNPTRWNGPFAGLIYFLTHPRMWPLPLLGIFISFLLTIYAVWKTVIWALPTGGEDWLPMIWHTLQMLGWGSLTLVLMILFVWPLILNYCFLKVFNRLLKREGLYVQADEGFFSSIGVFIRTLRWRIIWPLLILLSIFFIPLLTVPLSMLAINHLAVIEGADVALSAFGWKGKARSEWIQSHGTDCMALAISGSALNVLLSITLVGWILWVPAIFCGTFLFIKKNLLISKPDLD